MTTPPMSKYEVSARIQTVISKLGWCSSTRETTADEMVREFWEIVNDFPIPAHDEAPWEANVLQAAREHSANAKEYREWESGAPMSTETLGVLIARVNASCANLLDAVLDVENP